MPLHSPTEKPCLNQLVTSILIWLIEPSWKITSEDLRLRLKMLSAFLLVVLIGAFAITLNNFLPNGRPEFFLLNFSIFLLLTLCYFLSRSRYYALAVLLLEILIAGSIYASVMIDPQIYNVVVSLFFLTVGPLLAGVILNTRMTFLLGIFHLIVAVVIVRVVTQIPILDATFPLLYILIVSVIGIAIAFMREQYVQRVERQTQELAETAARYRNLFETASDAILIINQQGKYIDANSRASEMLGYSKDELLQIHSSDVMLPQNVAQAEAVVQKLLGGEIVFSEDQLRRKDGAIIDVQASVNLLPNGNIQGIFRDVTERKRTERILAETQHYLQSIINSAPVMVYILDEHGAISFIQGRGLLSIGMEAGQLIGQRVISVFENEADVLEVMQRLMRGESIDNQVRVADAIFETRITPILDDQGIFRGATGIAIDVTERKRAEEQQRALALEKEKSTMLEQLIDDITHDLRNPLTSMRTSLYLAARQGQSPDKVEKHFRAVDTQIDNMDKILSDLLEIVRLDQVTTSDFKLHRVDLNRLATEVVEEQSALAIQKKHQLELSTSDNLSPIFGDDIKLKRALTNLAVNALNYTPDGGRICVRTFKENGHVAFEVQDNGIGVDEKELPYIFERLYRSEKSRAMHKGGTGLGLAIVKKIVETHAGRIEVESKKGEGSRFVVWLPIHPRANK